jgi:hypothetical protein
VVGAVLPDVAVVALQALSSIAATATIASFEIRPVFIVCLSGGSQGPIDGASSNCVKNPVYTIL